MAVEVEVLARRPFSVDELRALVISDLSTFVVGEWEQSFSLTSDVDGLLERGTSWAEPASVDLPAETIEVEPGSRFAVALRDVPDVVAVVSVESPFDQEDVAHVLDVTISADAVRTKASLILGFVVAAAIATLSDGVVRDEVQRLGTRLLDGREVRNFLLLCAGKRSFDDFSICTAHRMTFSRA